MSNILLLNSEDKPLSPHQLRSIFEQDGDFDSIRNDEPGGAIVEARYTCGGDWTFVRLNKDGSTISLSGTSGAALSAAIVLQRHLRFPLRVIDTDYTFDLQLSDYSTVAQLEEAINRARTS